ncbi:MAG: phage tail protein [Ruminococcaceae bacterium]|nr:phage tail protein [Oscillospiraceae bacterium]
MDKNKITFGLKNVYYAKITAEGTDGVEYGKPVPMPGGASISLPKNVEKIAIAGDDDPEYVVIYDNKGYEGDLVLYDVPDSYLTDCLGMTVDGDTVVENRKDRPSPFALLFEFDGDKKKKRHVLYRCMGEKPDIASQTNGNGVNPNQVTLKLSATPAKNTGDIKRTCLQSENEVYNKWFDAVQVSGTSTAE